MGKQKFNSKIGLWLKLFCGPSQSPILLLNLLGVANMGKQKFANQAEMKEGVIADEDTVTGLVLAGVGHVTGNGQKNYLVVDSKTNAKEVEEKFNELTARKDIAMIFITQGCADEIRFAVDAYAASGSVIPTVLEIPSKEQPYDPRKDAIMQRVALFMPSAMAQMGIES